MSGLASLVPEVIARYPGLTAEESDGGIVLAGMVRLDAAREGRDYLVQDFPLRIIVSSDFPADLPRVFVEDQTLLEGYEHLMRDGSLCLGAPGEIALSLQSYPSLAWFMDEVVLGNLYAIEYNRIYGCLPAGERSHGAHGIVEAYYEMLGLEDFHAVLHILKCIHDKSYRGHLECPCGSGLRGRDCHGPMMLKIMNGSSWHVVSGDYEFVCEALEEARALAIEEDERKSLLRRLVGKHATGLHQ